jgi:2,4-dienoyl-CoA reductase-like NADH-dependent reductase (Old Yellow Enzyme family)
MGGIFDEARLGPLLVKNRIVRSATHEGMGDIQGYPTAALGEMYERLARGQVGTIVTGYAGVSPEGRACVTMRMFDEDKYIDTYRPIVDRVKDHGTAIVLQIAHGGAFAGIGLGDMERLAPSDYKSQAMGTTARELKEEEIESIINAFVDAIARAEAAGFDGVQLHAAHVYLLSQFLSPHINRRTDQWGGNTENRFRIVQEIVSRARKKVGPYPIFAKYSAYSLEKNGVSVDEGIRIGQLFESAGVDALEVSCGGMTDLFSAMRVPRTPVEAVFTYVSELRTLPRWKRTVMKPLFRMTARPVKPLHTYNVDAAQRIKQHLSIPVVVVGGIRTIEDMEAIVDGGKADFVAMCRPFIRTPGLVRRMMAGKQNRSTCTDCGYCLFLCAEHPVRCLNGKIPRDSEADAT